MNELLEVKISDYEGPLDLLIHLVYKNEMNIFDISISDITFKFIAEIRKMRNMDIEVAAEFINMASYLVYLKSRMLLPREGITDDDIDPEEATFKLKQLLIEYSFYKDISQMLREHEQNSSRFLSRGDSIVILREELLTEDSFKLASLFYDVSLSEKKEKKLVVKNSQIATEEVARRVKEFILSRETTLWSELFKQCSEKIEATVTFGTMLELVKAKRLTAFQEGAFTEILLKLMQEQQTEDTGAE